MSFNIDKISLYFKIIKLKKCHNSKFNIKEKMKKFIILIMLGLAPFVFWSCSDDGDDNPVNPTVKNYFPLYVGNYWVYEKYTLDSNNNRISTSLKIDSAYCGNVSQEVIKDSTRSVYTLVHYSSGMLDPEQKFYLSNDQIYQNYQIVPGIDLSVFGVNVNDYLNIEWLLLIDQKNPNWIGYPQQTLNLDNVEIPNLGMTVSMALTLELKGKSIGEGTFAINNKTVKTKDYELDWNISGTIKSPLLGNIPLPIQSFTLQTIYKLADHIGIVSIKTNSQKVSVLNNPTLPSFQMLGTEQSLIRYQIFQDE